MASDLGLEKKLRAAAMKDQFRDLKRYLPSLQMRIVLDIGANIGQSTHAFRQAFPAAQIFAFEPVRQAFQQLKERHQADANIRCFNCALGDCISRVTIESQGVSLRNRVVAASQGSTPTEDIEMLTGDAFCAEHKIKHIDFLKIDAEGYDLKVCSGFSKMLSGYQIDLIQVETGMNPDNRTHVPFQHFVEFFWPRGYLIFRIYDQALSRKRPRLRRANAVFVSKDLLKKISDAR